MSVLHHDTEIFSECDLKASGVYRYAEHESTELLCDTFRFDKETPILWIPFTLPPDFKAELIARLAGRAEVHDRSEMPPRVRKHIEEGGEVRAHNAQFERVVLNGVAGKKLNFPHCKIEQTVCTAAKAAAAGLPRALGDCAAALGTAAKDDTGRISMLQITKPKKPTKKDASTRWTIENAPEKYLDVYCYNVDDVLAECGVDDAVPDLTSYEQEVYWLDQKINDRGISVDLPAVRTVMELIEEYKNFLALAMEKATRPPIDPLSTEPAQEGLKPTQRDKLAGWIRANGFPDLLDMQAATIEKLVKRDDVPDNIKHVLRIYSTYGAKATTKFDAMVEAVCADGRLRGMLLFHGAGTGRWSSMLINLQNLFRPVIDDPETAVIAFRSKNLEWIKALYPGIDLMKVFGSTVRSHLVAPPGKKFVSLDFAGVESRFNAWAWDETWKVEAFRAYDRGEGPDTYCIAYADLFQVDPRDVTKQQRTWGKPIDLFGQYEGGVGAFVNLAGQYRVNLFELTERLWPHIPEDVLDSATWMWNKFGRGSELPERVWMACDSAKQIWRRKHPATTAGWKELKNAAELAVQFPGSVYSFAKGKGAFKVIPGPAGHEWLCMSLPARRRLLRYFKPEWTPPRMIIENEPVRNFDGVIVGMREVEREIPGELHYMGIDTDTRRWMRTSSYGGAWNNHFIQGGCADLLRNGMLELEGGGYPVVLTVHDENNAEVDETFGSVEEAGALMCAEKPWFAGLPLVAEGWEGGRYRK